MYRGVTREISGGNPATTNNRMELEAAIQALRALKEACIVEFYTDSKYLRNGITRWVQLWKKRGWMTNGRRPVKNETQWRDLDLLACRHTIIWHWVQGHGTNTQNRKCDRLARLEIAKINRAYTGKQLEAFLLSFGRRQFRPPASAASSGEQSCP
jgi:ribonuclease HI